MKMIWQENGRKWINKQWQCTKITKNNLSPLILTSNRTSKFHIHQDSLGPFFHCFIGPFRSTIPDQALAMTLPPPSMVPGTAQLALRGMIISVIVSGQNLGTFAISQPYPATKQTPINRQYKFVFDEFLCGLSRWILLSLLMLLTLAFHFAKLSKIPGKLRCDFQDSGRL